MKIAPSLLYELKVVSQVKNMTPDLSDPATDPVYKKVTTLIEEGHRAFFSGLYQRAVNLYLKAYDAVLKLEHKDLPPDFSFNNQELILSMDLFQPLTNWVAKTGGTGNETPAFNLNLPAENLPVILGFEPRYLNLVIPVTNQPRPTVLPLPGMVNNRIAHLEINKPDSQKVLLDTFYKIHMEAVTLGELNTNRWIANNCLIYFPKEIAFALPLSLGDAYHATGDFENAEKFYIKARNYPYLNFPIEAEVVWQKLAQNATDWGDHLYKEENLDGAALQYNKVVRIPAGNAWTIPGLDENTLPEPGEDPVKTREKIAQTRQLVDKYYTERKNSGRRDGSTSPNIVPADSPLYSGRLMPLAERAGDFLKQYLTSTGDLPDKIYDIWPSDLATLLLQCGTRLHQMDNSLPLSGFSADAAPVFTYRYLQGVTRLLAGQAISTERSYIEFKSNAEKEAFTRGTLEANVVQEENGVEVEERRVQSAQAYVDQAYEALNQAQSRCESAWEAYNQYNDTSQAEIDLDLAGAYTSFGKPNDIECGEWMDLLKSIQYFDSKFSYLTTNQQKLARDSVLLPGDVFIGQENQTEMGFIAYRKGQIVQQRELERLFDIGVETERNFILTRKQINTAESQKYLCNAQLDLAKTRRDSAISLRNNFNSHYFTSERWDQIAEKMKNLSRIYLERAIGSALLMQCAFNTEQQTKVSRIRSNYAMNALDGILAADQLLADVDGFISEELLRTKKRISLRTTISLSERYPSQFYGEFLYSGKLDFATVLDDFEARLPGSFNQRIRAIEIQIEGLAGPQGIMGTLTQNGITVVSKEDGTHGILMRKAETLLLSQFDQRRDGIFFKDFGEESGVFEYSGVAGGWFLDIPPESNDLIYPTISDVKFILYYDAMYSAELAGKLKGRGIIRNEQGKITFSLSKLVPDTFSSLKSERKVNFLLRSPVFPYYPTSPVLKSLRIDAITPNENPYTEIPVYVQLGLNLPVAGKANLLSAGKKGKELPGSITGLFDQPLVGNWLLSFPTLPLTVAVEDIIVSIEYQYESTLTLSVANRFSEEFFTLQDNGTVSFNVKATNFGYNELDPVIKKLSIILKSSEELNAANLPVLKVKLGDTEVEQKVTVEGVASSKDKNSPFNLLKEKPLIGEWNLGISDSIPYQSVDDLILVIEYSFYPRNSGKSR
ncbi:MAG: hypothetical protein NTX61_12735 [Bacteroidetes bacterium]|nr:hypothetical protein [Bacteroidota bacterium]